MNVGVLALLFLFPLFLLATSFTRIYIVLSFVRKGLGEIAVPSGQILFGLSLLFSFLVMNEPLQKIYDHTIIPFFEGKKTPSQALKESELPLREFMSIQVSKSDLDFVQQYTRESSAKNKTQSSFIVLLGAFALSELKKGLYLGFILWVPFLIIDLLSSLIISSLSLHSLNVQIVSIPLKIMLFLALDGWKLLFGTIAESYWVR
jgi:flagellar biosynthetic protein FliP